MPDIVLKNVTKRFGKFVAVNNLNLKIDDKDFITLLGPSGCGKTTTLRMIAGLESPTEGEIYIDNKLVFSAEKGIDVSPDKRNVGFLFQNYALWPHMTVYKNIAFGLENLKWSKDKINERVTEMVKMLKVDKFIDRYPAELSGGQQQRVAIARTLAPGPKVLFMDEPLSNLDAKLRMEMRSELKRLHLETGSTVVYVTHDQLEAMTLSTKICLIREGELQQYKAPLEIYNNPSNVFVADFVGNPGMNFVDVKGENVNLDEIKIQCMGLDLMFTPVSGSITINKDQELVLGIRPEHISITDKGGVKGKIYSSLPSGMETIIKIKVNDTILTAVVFGECDFAVDQEVNISFDYSKYILFDKKSGKNMARGKIEVI